MLSGEQTDLTTIHRYLAEMRVVLQTSADNLHLYQTLAKNPLPAKMQFCMSIIHLAMKQIESDPELLKDYIALWKVDLPRETCLLMLLEFLDKLMLCLSKE